MAPIPEHVTLGDAQFYIHAKWKLCWVLWPHRCNITGRRLIPGTLAYRGRARYEKYVSLPWSTPNMTIEETRWHGKIEHLLWHLKNE